MKKKRKMYETCSKLTIKAAEQHSGVPFVNFEQISRYCFGVFIVDTHWRNKSWLGKGPNVSSLI